MGKQLDNLAAFKEMVANQSPTAPIRIQLDDAQAVALLEELDTTLRLRHPEAIAKRLPVLKAALAIPMPTDVHSALAWAKSIAVASAKFWDAIQGEEINGVEILRKPDTPTVKPETEAAEGVSP